MDKDLVKIAKDLPNGKWRVEIEMTDGELAALGRVTSQWAYLEHAVFIRTAEVCKASGLAIPKEAANLSFTQRIRAYREILSTIAQKTPLTKEMERLLGKISNAENKRHKVIHGLWTWDEKDPQKQSAYSFRPRVGFSDTPFDESRLTKLGDEIAEINFQLTYPNGLADVETVALPNRSAALGLGTTIPSSPHPPQSKTPKPERQR